MNMSFPSREQVASIRKNYPPGTRVMLNNMNDPYSPVEPGTRGTVRYVDDSGQLGVAWDNGRSLSLIPGEDSFRKLTQQEIIQEQRMKMEEARLDEATGVYYVTDHVADKKDATRLVPTVKDGKGKILIKGLEDDEYSYMLY